MSTHWKKKNDGDFFFFSDPNNSFPHRKTWNTEKRLLYFDLRVLLPIQIQLQEIEIPKNPKIYFPY
jgi:hypothetical protein